MAERIPFADLQERIAAAPAIARLRHLAAQIHAETSAAIRAENIRQNQIWGRLDNRLAR